MNIITPEIIESLGTIVVAVLTILLSRLAHYAGKKAKTEYQREVIDRAHVAAVVGVREVEQTFSRSLKAESEDGHLSAEDAQLAAEGAVNRARNHLGKEGVKDLAKILGHESVDGWLRSLVEATVRAEKGPQ